MCVTPLTSPAFSQRLVPASAASVAIQHSGAVARSNAAVNSELRRHVVSLCNDRLLKTDGTLGTDAKTVEENINACAGKTRIALYAHGGLVDEESPKARQDLAAGTCELVCGNSASAKRFRGTLA